MSDDYPTHPLIEDVEEVYALPEGSLFWSEANGGMLCKSRGESKDEILAEAERLKSLGRSAVFTVADLMPVRLVYHPHQYQEPEDDYDPEEYYDPDEEW